MIDLVSSISSGFGFLRFLIASAASITVVSLYRIAGGDPLAGFIASGLIIGVFASRIKEALASSVVATTAIAGIGFLISTLNSTRAMAMLNLVADIAGVPLPILILIYIVLAMALVTLSSVSLFYILRIVLSSRAKG